MRAARFHGIGKPIQVEEVPDPEAGPDEVVVDVAACGLCGSDVHFLEDMPVPGPLPMTLGHEPAGILSALGPGVEGWALGDRVALTLGDGCGQCRPCLVGHPNRCTALHLPGLHTDGAFAERVKVPGSALVEVPEGVSLAAAAVATDCVATPYHALRCRAGLSKGERVAVIGVGGVGTQAVGLAGVLGAGQVVAVDLSSTALERAQAAGATSALLVDAGEDPSARLRQETDGGADIVVECVGVPETVSAAVRALAPGGRLVIVGVGLQPPRIDLPQALFALAELSVLGSFGSHREDLIHVLEMEREGRIDIESSISHRVDLDGVADGLEMLQTKRDDPQRIVMELAR